MKKRLLIFGLGVTLSGAVIFALYRAFEIYPLTRETPPSARALDNPFLALERWLEGAGRPPRTLKRGDCTAIAGARENVIFIEASAFDWEDAERLVTIIEEGRVVILSLNKVTDAERGRRSFLEQNAFSALRKTEDEDDRTEGEGEPALDPALALASWSEADETYLRGPEGDIRLIERAMGAGRLCVTGRAFFMRNEALKVDGNALLAWRLLAEAPGAEEGILFIAGGAERPALLGNMFKWGNPVPPAAALALLLAIGLWMALPRFGLYREGLPEGAAAPDGGVQAGRPPLSSLKKRLSAELNFYRRWGALAAYTAPYEREIRRRAARRGLSDAAIDALLADAAPRRGGASPAAETIRRLQDILASLEGSHA